MFPPYSKRNVVILKLYLETFPWGFERRFTFAWIFVVAGTLGTKKQVHVVHVAAKTENRRQIEENIRTTPMQEPLTTIGVGGRRKKEPWIYLVATTICNCKNNFKNILTDHLWPVDLHCTGDPNRKHERHRRSVPFASTHPGKGRCALLGTKLGGWAGRPQPAGRCVAASIPSLLSSETSKRIPCISVLPKSPKLCLVCDLVCTCTTTIYPYPRASLSKSRQVKHILLSSSTSSQESN
jgi:hypothetical protein